MLLHYLHASSTLMERLPRSIPALSPGKEAAAALKGHAASLQELGTTSFANGSGSKAPGGSCAYIKGDPLSVDLDILTRYKDVKGKK